MLSCPLCRTSNKNRLLGKYRSSELLLKNRDLIRCNRCGLISVHPMLNTEEIQKLNFNYWNKHQSADSFYTKTIHSALMQSRISWFKGCRGRILDVGAGHGILKRELKSQHVNVVYDAVEMDKNCWQTLSDLGADKIFADLHQISGQLYDVIFCSHILEHIPDSCQFLSHLSGFLKDGGKLFIEVPNQDHLYKKSYGTHLVFFNVATIKQVVLNSGLSVDQITTVGLPLNILINQSKTSSEKREKFRAFLPNPFNKSISLVANGIRRFLLTPDKLIQAFQMTETGDDRQWIRCIAMKR